MLTTLMLLPLCGATTWTITSLFPSLIRIRSTVEDIRRTRHLRNWTIPLLDQQSYGASATQYNWQGRFFYMTYGKSRFVHWCHAIAIWENAFKENANAFIVYTYTYTCTLHACILHPNVIFVLETMLWGFFVNRWRDSLWRWSCSQCAGLHL